MKTIVSCHGIREAMPVLNVCMTLRAPRQSVRSVGRPKVIGQLANKRDVAFWPLLAFTLTCLLPTCIKTLQARTFTLHFQAFLLPEG